VLRGGRGGLKRGESADQQLSDIGVGAEFGHDPLDLIRVLEHQPDLRHFLLQAAGVRQDDCQRIDLRLPSGAGLVASDFEGWLYVAPCLIVTKVTVTPPALTVSVGPAGEVTGTIVTGSSPPEAVTPTAVITVSYPAIANATVTISLSPTDTGVTNIVTVPGSATILSGQTSVSVPISVVGNPGAGTTLNFSISASATALIGGPVIATGDFSVTGAAAG
jgi:hypothetical protein